MAVALRVLHRKQDYCRSQLELRSLDSFAPDSVPRPSQSNKREASIILRGAGVGCLGERGGGC